MRLGARIPSDARWLNFNDNLKEAVMRSRKRENPTAGEFSARWRRTCRMLFLAAVVSLLPGSPGAKMYEEPQSFALRDSSQDEVQRKVLPMADSARLLAEDRAREADRRRPVPHRFAVAADVSYTLNDSGTWQTVTGGRLWRLRIQSPGAKSLNLGITRFDMPDGAKLWIYDPAHTHVEGPIPRVTAATSAACGPR
jgi:lysyl endopeptidase